MKRRPRRLEPYALESGWSPPAVECSSRGRAFDIGPAPGTTKQGVESRRPYEYACCRRPKQQRRAIPTMDANRSRRGSGDVPFVRLN